MDFQDLAEAPIHAIGSGPSMAPIAGRHYAKTDVKATTAIVADTGGTTYDVSLVRKGIIPMTPETWIGQRYRGHIVGFPSVDVKSIGAGGGSIAWVDEGGLLHVGPISAGAVPGPACYGKGGTRPTVTDASLVLGYVDPAFFLGGAMKLEVERAVETIEKEVARPLRLSLPEAALAILRLMSENMVGAIEEITIHQGMDPRGAVLVGGGGAAVVGVVGCVRRRRVSAYFSRFSVLGRFSGSFGGGGRRTSLARCLGLTIALRLGVLAVCGFDVFCRHPSQPDVVGH